MLFSTWRGNLKQSRIYNNEFLSCQVPSWRSHSKLPSNIIGVSWLSVYMYITVRYINSPPRLSFSANGFESGRNYNNYRYVGPVRNHFWDKVFNLGWPPAWEGCNARVFFVDLLCVAALLNWIKQQTYELHGSNFTLSYPHLKNLFSLNKKDLKYLKTKKSQL